eukprot:tig00000903_g5533.t1
MALLSSAAPVLALLDETDPQLQYHALKRLDDLVDSFWHEIADSIAKIESLYEDDRFSHRDLAALVASKVFYHLGEFNDALTYALGAGNLFDVSVKNEYVQTLVAKCIDEYIALRIKQQEAAKDAAAPIDARLENIVERMFERCFREGEYKQAIGIALEARRLDKVEAAIKASNDVPALLSYAFDLTLNLVASREFRQKVLEVVVKLHRAQAEPDYVAICQCFMFLDDAAAVADVLNTLVKAGGDEALLAYQVAFDLCDNELQQFLISVRGLLPNFEKKEEKKEAGAEEKKEGEAEEKKEGDAMAVEPKAEEQDAGYLERLAKLKSVLSGELSVALHLEFLYRHNHADLLILKNIKAAVESRNAVCHSAAIFCNALMHAGTTVDAFLRENLDWLGRATNWAKFSATAGLGVIHRGHVKESLSVLAPYLPSGAQGGSPFSEGGALYALGLIHANHGSGIVQYLRDALRNAGTNETVQHGACLGLGLAAMTTSNDEVYEELKGVLFSDSAVAGEAAGLAMGMVMLGSASGKAVEELLTYAHETQHEKIIRGLAMGIALVMYGREEEADVLIEQLSRDKDPILRYGGAYTIGLAYCGTANNSAIRRLLHAAVSDVSDDVRRAAVTALGFLLFRVPQQCPRIVQLLAESYNPHVRYGATLAVGISCAGTALPEAVELLEPMASDPVDFVRQGALLALAMVLVQASPSSNPRAAAARKLFERVIADKHEDVMTKFGAILASGIIDAGGRNATIALSSRAGHRRLSAIVGMAIFTQFWYWYPLVHMVSLTFTPTALIGLNADLKMPKFEVTSNARPSLFAYPPPAAPPAAAAVAKAPTAVLSVTARARARAKQAAASSMTVADLKRQQQEEERKLKEEEEAKKKKEEKREAEKAPAASSSAPPPPPPPPPPPAPGRRDGHERRGGRARAAAPPSPRRRGPPLTPGWGLQKEGEEKEKKEEKKAPEATSEQLSNPARVVPPQEKHVAWPEGGRYRPVPRGRAAGVVLLRDLKPGEPVELVDLKAPAAAGAAGPEEKEPEPPQAFTFP